MDVSIERCAGLDIHRDTVVVTGRRPGSGGARRSQTRTFSTITGQLEELAEWLVSAKMTLAGMESTGVYGKPVHPRKICRYWQGAACDYKSNGSSHVPSAAQYPRRGDGRKGA